MKCGFHPHPPLSGARLSKQGQAGGCRTEAFAPAPKASSALFLLAQWYPRSHCLRAPPPAPGRGCCCAEQAHCAPNRGWSVPASALDPARNPLTPSAPAPSVLQPRAALVPPRPGRRTGGEGTLPHPGFGSSGHQPGSLPVAWWVGWELSLAHSGGGSSSELPGSRLSSAALRNQRQLQ